MKMLFAIFIYLLIYLINYLHVFIYLYYLKNTYSSIVSGNSYTISAILTNCKGPVQYGFQMTLKYDDLNKDSVYLTMNRHIPHSRI